MMPLVLVSAALRLLLTVVLTRMLMRLGHILNWRERFGAGVMGGTGFLTVPVILDLHNHGTPFDTWAGFAFSLGAVIFFWGFIDRKLGHERRNEEAVKQARQHMGRKTA